MLFRDKTDGQGDRASATAHNCAEPFKASRSLQLPTQLFASPPHLQSHLSSTMKYFTALLVLLVLAMAHTSEALSMSQVAGYWKRGGGSSSSCPTAVAVAWAESHGNPRARGNNPGSYDRGLWQINSKWHPDVSDSCAYDAACNAKNAVRISSGGSRWSPWATYNHGKHNKYMSQARSACSSSRDEDDSAGLSIPDSGSKTWGTPQGKFGQGHVNWSGLSNLFKDEDEDAFSGLRMCCQAILPKCLECHARNRQIFKIAKFRKAQSRTRPRRNRRLGGCFGAGKAWPHPDCKYNPWSENKFGDPNRVITRYYNGHYIGRFDEDDDALGGFSDPPHLGAQRPTGESIGNWLNLRL